MIVLIFMILFFLIFYLMYCLLDNKNIANPNTLDWDLYPIGGSFSDALFSEADPIGPRCRVRPPFLTICVRHLKHVSVHSFSHIHYTNQFHYTLNMGKANFKEFCLDASFDRIITICS